MELNFAFKILIYLVIAGMSPLLIEHFIINGKKSLLLYSFIAFQALIFLWAFHDIILETQRLVRPLSAPESIYQIEVYHVLEFFLTCFIPYVWLVFSTAYSGSRLSDNKILLLNLFIPPLFFYILHFSHFFNSLNWSDMGMREVLFLLYVTMCYSYLIWGTALIIKNTWRQIGYSKKQAILLSMCILLPLVSNIIQNVRVHILRKEYEVFGIDITLVSFAITMLLSAVAALKYRFLKAVPYAMRELFSSMDQSVVVLDRNNNIIEYNKSFIASFSNFLNLGLSQNISILTGQLRIKAEHSKENEEFIRAVETDEHAVFTGELTFYQQGGRSYTVNIRPVFINKLDYAGKVIVFNDITGLKKMIHELHEKNAELFRMNEQLKVHSATVEALAVERERNRLARDVHDTLGQSLTIINTLLSGSMISCEKDVTGTKKKLAAALAITKDSLNEIRRVVKGLPPEKLGSDNLVDSLKRLIKDFELSGLTVELNTDDFARIITAEQGNFLYRLCQEALTNSVRHGKAKRVQIIVQVKDRMLRVFIADDGVAAKTMNKGMGLIGMEQRARELGGSVRHWFGESRGFNIYAELPLACCFTKVQTGGEWID